MCTICDDISAQYITVGQTAGINIHHFDIEDINLATPMTNGSVFSFIDINNDNYNDFKIIAKTVLNTPSEQSKLTGIEPFTQYPYSVHIVEKPWGTNTNKYVKRFFYGDTIWNYSLWCTDLAIFQKWDFFYGISGFFWGDGYLAFKMEAIHDTIIGWMRVSATATNITIFEYAYYSVLTSMPFSDNSGCKISVSTINKDQLNIAISTTSNNILFDCNIFNIYGQNVLSSRLNSAVNIVDIQQLPVGTYILKILNRDNLIFSTHKFIRT